MFAGTNQLESAIIEYFDGRSCRATVKSLESAGWARNVHQGSLRERAKHLLGSKRPGSELPDTASRSSSDSSSDSSSSSGSDSDTDSDSDSDDASEDQSVPIAAAVAAASGEVKAQVVPQDGADADDESSSSSDSDSDSESDSDSDSDSEGGAKTGVAGSSDSSSSDSRSSDSSSSDSSSSDSSSSDSDSSSDSSDDEKDKEEDAEKEEARAGLGQKRPRPTYGSDEAGGAELKFMQKPDEELEDGHVAKRGRTEAAPTTPGAPPVESEFYNAGIAGFGIGSAAPRPNGRVSDGKRKAFCRINVEEEAAKLQGADHRIRDNSYAGTFGDKGWGARASQAMMRVRGKDFRHEKTKRKRGGYRGGRIDPMAVTSYIFEDSG